MDHFRKMKLVKITAPKLLKGCKLINFTDKKCNLTIKWCNSSLSECYFARKGSNTIEGRLGNMSTELSLSQTSIASVGSDIALHLQSMFCLLRPEETLKMVSYLKSLMSDDHVSRPFALF